MIDVDELIKALRHSETLDRPDIATYCTIISRENCSRAADALKQLQAENKAQKDTIEAQQREIEQLHEQFNDFALSAQTKLDFASRRESDLIFKNNDVRREAEQLRTERDAAVEDIPHYCDTCKSKPKNCSVDNPDKYIHHRSKQCDAWQYRGRKGQE